MATIVAITEYCSGHDVTCALADGRRHVFNLPTLDGVQAAVDAAEAALLDSEETDYEFEGE